MKRIVTLGVVGLLSASTVVAQTPARALSTADEHFGLGGFGGLGTSALSAIRVSVPLGTTAGLDVDIGRVHTGDDPNRAIGAQVRWLWRGRATHGGSGYWLFGVLRLNETRRYWAGAGRERWEVVERRAPTMPQVGYGWDWQGRRGTRLGLELMTGSEGEAGPRAFAKLFIVWGPPLGGTRQPRA